MSFETKIDELARASALTDARDPVGLIALQEQFQETVGLIERSTLGALADAFDVAIEMIDSIVMREVDDPDASLQTIFLTIEFAQLVAEATANGEDLSTISMPSPEADEPLDDLDQDLLNAWISGCSDTLNELEGNVVEIEAADDSAEEQVGEARRRIHTFKGECGVLSLHAAQKLCHDAETLIDVRIESGEPFPADSILALVDWMRSYVQDLSNDARAAVPEHDALAKQLAGDTVVDSADGAPPETLAATDDTPVTAISGTSADAVDTTDDNPVTFPAEAQPDENFNDFLCEAREHIASAEEALLELEQDLKDNELINTVFRAFHTIKGVAGFMNLEPIVRLAHQAEFLLDAARSEKLTLNSRYLDLILNSCDMLLSLLAALEGAEPPTCGQLNGLIHRLKLALDGEFTDAAPSTSAPNFALLGELLVAMKVVSADDVAAALAQQAAGATELQQLLQQAGLTGAESVEEELIDPASSNGRFIYQLLIDLQLATNETLDAAIEARRSCNTRIGQLLGVDSQELAPALREQRRMRRDDAPAETSEATSTAVAASAAPPATATAPVAPAPSKTATSPPARKKQKADQTVKVNTGRMDVLVTMVGELVIAQQMVVQDEIIQGLTDQRLQRNLGHTGKIIRDLQEVAMSLRMVTLKGTFQKMARLVRDVAGKADKNIRFNMEGEDTELDRNVVEEIADPLVHMIRNSCDHGIEPAADRIAAGKEETGNLTLRAYHQGGSIIIEIQDDGRGLNREKILSKAIEKGIYTPDRELSEIPDSEVWNLIFLPGFSTADKVTDISGRGVGMDVVRRNIQALRGKVDIESTAGKGSIFRMALPLTMAIIDGMVVRVGSQRYVIPTLSIEQSFRPEPEALHSVVGRGEMVSVRGSLLPIHRLKGVFGLEQGYEDVSDALLIVLETNDSRCALLVDEILGQQQVVIKSLGQGIQSIQGVSGGAILGDGRVALIIDVGGLVNQATGSGR